MDNIFVLNHLIKKSKQTESKERKVYALFADLKAAFDRMDRDIMGITKEIWNQRAADKEIEVFI